MHANTTENLSRAKAQRLREKIKRFHHEDCEEHEENRKALEPQIKQYRKKLI